MFSKAKDEAGGRAKKRLPPTIISADMHVFVDEYIARIAETYSR